MNTTSAPNYYPALDGIRGIAILLVVIYHNFGFFGRYFFFGWLGVDLFFVLSGFLITEILLKTRGSRNYLRNFYARRILRIFPLYYLTLFFFFIIIPAFSFQTSQLDYFLRNQSWFWLYLQNWLFIFEPPPSFSNILNHLWSLAVEEQFYLIWPFAILALKNTKAIIYLLLFLLLGVIVLRFVLWTFHLTNVAYFNLYTFSRIDGICIGSMLAVFRSFNPKVILQYFTLIVFGLAALNFVFYFFNKKYEFSFPYLAVVGYTTFAVVFGLLVNEGIEGANPVLTKLFQLPPLRFLGKISYGLYVFHWPIHLALGPFLQDGLASGIGPYASIVTPIATTGLSVVLALASYHFFEKKFLVLKKNFQ